MIEVTRNRSNVRRHWKDNSIDSAALLEYQERSNTKGQQTVPVFVISAVESQYSKYSLRYSSNWRFASAKSIGWVTSGSLIWVSPDNVRFLLMLSAPSEERIFRYSWF